MKSQILIGCGSNLKNPLSQLSKALHLLSSKDLLNKHDKEIKCLTMPDNFQDHASQKEQLAKAGLDTDGLMKVVSKMIPLSNVKNKSITN